MARRPSRWRAFEDRWLGRLAELEARAAGRWRPGVRYLPTEGLREGIRWCLIVVVVALLLLALPPAPRRTAYLLLFFVSILGGLAVAWRDNQRGAR